MIVYHIEHVCIALGGESGFYNKENLDLGLHAGTLTDTLAR